MAENKTVTKHDRFMNIMLFALSLLVAFILWFYATSEEVIIQSKTFTDIPITVSTNGSYLLLDDYIYTLDVTVSGTQKNLDEITSDDFTASADASNVSKAGKYTLDVAVTSPAGIDITGQSVSSIVVALDRQSTVTVPVKVELANYSVSDPYEIGRIECSLESVSVSGPDELIKTISSAVCKINAGSLTANSTFGGTLVAIDENGETVKGDIHLSESSAKVNVIIYTSKSVSLKADFLYGYYTSSNSEIAISPSSIVIKGEKSVLDSISEIPLTTIDEKLVLTDSVSRIITLPEGVINVSGIETATVSITLKNIEDFVITTGNIGVINPNNIDYTLKNKSIDITIRGPKAMASTINAENVSVSIDLSDVNAGDGEVSVEAEITINSMYSGFYELGKYTVTVNV